jgi:isopentenyl-diphosphate Delta-isomerase
MSDVSNRKKEHLDLAMDDRSQTVVTAGWEDIHLVPASIPTVGADDVSLTTDLGGFELDAPFIIASMTGGHDEAIPINERLADVAQRLGLAIGSGSQRAALRDPRLARTYEVIRETAPDAVVLANIGVCQLVQQGTNEALTRDEVESAVGMLDAQFMIVHLNVVEELIQPEGDGSLIGLSDAIARLVDWCPVPVIAKETGSGMSRESARLLVDIGVSLLDVGGAGGTSFARIEGLRAASMGDVVGARLGTTYSDWGIPTAASLTETNDAGVPVIATGGIRSGLDTAKALSLGATAVGVGRPALEQAIIGTDALLNEMEAFIQELRLAVVLTGCQSSRDLVDSPSVITGFTKQWIESRRPHG